MRSRYTHGVVKVPYCAVEIYSWCSQGALIVRSRYTHGVVKVHLLCGRDILMV